MNIAIKTVEGIYDGGLLRPLEPIENREGLVYIITVLDIKDGKRLQKHQDGLRGKYRDVLSSSEQFSRNKQVEKSLEI